MIATENNQVSVLNESAGRPVRQRSYGRSRGALHGGVCARRTSCAAALERKFVERDDLGHRELLDGHLDGSESTLDHSKSSLLDDRAARSDLGRAQMRQRRSWSAINVI